jgi:uncharacterized protein (TIGR00369 family)
MKNKVPEYAGCFVCGVENPFGLRLELFHEDGIVTAEYTPKAEHTGYADTVHGGIISAILDEVMVWAPWSITGKRFFTAEITVRFSKPLKTDVKATATGKIVKSTGRLHFAEAELKDAGGTVYATATGKYIEMKEA